MQALALKSLLFVGITAAVASLAGTYVLGLPAPGKACKAGSCTYFDAQRQPHPGKCGSKKTDPDHCYCIDKVDTKLSQIQAGCALSR